MSRLACAQSSGLHASVAALAQLGLGRMRRMLFCEIEHGPDVEGFFTTDRPLAAVSSGTASSDMYGQKRR